MMCDLDQLHIYLSLLHSFSTGHQIFKILLVMTHDYIQELMLLMLVLRAHLVRLPHRLLHWFRHRSQRSRTKHSSSE